MCGECSIRERDSGRTPHKRPKEGEGGRCELGSCGRKDAVNCDQGFRKVLLLGSSFYQLEGSGVFLC